MKKIEVVAMEATDLSINGNKMVTSTSLGDEGQAKKRGGGRGGWITFPFITVGLMGVTVAANGWMSNLIVYLIGHFNIESIDATQVFNIVNGTSNFFPVVGAIIADSFSGNFSVISISSFVSLLGMILLTLTATTPSLRPQHCMNVSTACQSPSAFQFGILYTSITLLCIGVGGTRFTLATMGADQFDKAKHQAIFFNWYFFTFYVALTIGSTAIVYVQDNVGWGLGFGVCLAANAIALAVILLGKGYYRHVKPQGSPFMSLARVVVATIRKRKVTVSSGSEIKEYYHGDNEDTKGSTAAPSVSFRFLNRAALITEGDTNQDGSIAKVWKLCTVQQVEDLKNLIRIFPLWSSGIFLGTPIGIQSSLLVLQALTMDRHIGPHFQIPAGSFLVFTLLSTAISIFILDRFLFPTWQKFTRRSLTPLQRVGIGHILNVVGMAGSALVESRRLHIARSHQLTDQPGAVVPMSAMWLIAPLAVVGVGEAFHFPGNVGLFYQEFPSSLRSTATAMISLLIALAFYLSTALIELVRKLTTWLPANINHGRLDNVFWLLVVLGVINFIYYITCSMLYKYQNVEKSEESSTTS